MNKNFLAGFALAAALIAGTAQATTVDFSYDLLGTDVATGSFSFADGSVGTLGYADLTAFSLTVQGVTYSLADVQPLTDYVHFAYDTAANTFVVDPNSCGFAGCGFQSSLSAINSTGSFGFFFTGAPGAYTEYTTGNSGSFDSINLSPGGGVPEPAAWAFMMLGVAGMGGALRATRRRTAALA
jgi:hypothetical protein